ncbi:chitooligosaccharidolytic beta-N-acetylglucosaminidase [Galleria mellonella]|uniref:Chitooligosaccharidolytic beta-N-acetylglucosaminidase n=1 Tax=Galleria mellonella TaxID=7137 RepID=A0A6J1WZG4_GALME|nr:chitooligosaccharidolytic beta-N-acetylglucosaminidase [Galleria mellonella]
MAGNSWMLLAVLAIHLVQCKVEKVIEDPASVVYKPSWMYKCMVNEGCQRTEHPQPLGNAETNATSHLYQNVNLCRTVCGRFGGLWPRPVSATLSTQTVKIHPQYLRYDLVDVPVETRELLAQMTQVTSENIMAECGGNVTELVTTPVVVYLTVKSDVIALTWDTNEEYFLDVQTKDGTVVVKIMAETVYGVRHGLESFTQLISADKPDYSDSSICGLRIVSGAKIRDRPVYKHRGFVLDTSRHFIPMKDIKRTMDGMAATKMNVFHWHVTDSHSFPLESSRVPQFTRYGAYSASEIYTVEEVRQLIKYAQIRGIRVVIEIDAPAHSGNGWQWGKDYGFGDLAVCVNSEPWRRLCIQPPCGQLNPANPVLYRVLRSLYRDIVGVLPKPALFHMGGDEVFFGCWNSSQDITSYMANKGFETNTEGFMRLWAEFQAKALQLWDEELVAEGAEANQPVMIWSSELTQAHRIKKYLNKDRYVIEVWEPESSPLLNQLMRLGYRVVSIPKDVWYLDHGFWGQTKYSNWRRMYSYMLPRDPNVLGGEIAMWTEYVDTEVLDTRVWPRAAAAAERLWADPSAGAQAAEARLQRLRARLRARGLRADALAPAWCEQHDARCI